MIVQPTPAAPSNPLRRALRISGVVAPVLLLFLVVAIGVAGQPESAPAAPRPTAPTAANAGTGASAAPTVMNGATGSSAAPVPAPTPPAYPTIAADLGVRSIGEARDWLDNVTPGPVAVAGWLTSLHAYGDCPASGGDTRGTLGPLCPRRARFGASPAGAGDPYVRLSIPAGTRLPPELEHQDAEQARVPMVVIGHTGYKEYGCDANADDCRDDLVVERVTWADGAPFDPGPVYDAYLEMAPSSFMFRNLASARTLAVGGVGTVLQEALVRPTTVARLDPDAADAMTAGPRPHDLVWYVRGLEPFDTGLDAVHDQPPRYSWAILDYETGATIARGPSGEVSP